MLAYTKLWILLEKRGMKRTDLKKVISSATLAKLGKNEIVSTTVIEKICAFLECQPGDIMEYISEESVRAAVDQIDATTKVMMKSFKDQGYTKDQIATMLKEAFPSIIDSLYDGADTFNNIYDKAYEEIKKES